MNIDDSANEARLRFLLDIDGCCRIRTTEWMRDADHRQQLHILVRL